MNGGLDPIAISAFRSLLTAVLMLAWTLAHARGRPRIDRRALVLAALGGIAMCGNFGFFFISIDYAGATIAVIVKAVAPLMIVALAVLFRLERFSFGKLAAVLMVFVGVALVSTGESLGRTMTVSWQGVAAALLAATFYAGWAFAFRAAQRSADPLPIVAIAVTVAMAGFYLWEGAWPYWPGEWSGAQFVAVIYIASLGTAVAFVAYVKGMQTVEAGIVAMLAAIEPVVGAAISWLWLGQSLDAVQLLGGILIVLTVTVVSYRRATGRL